MAGLGLPNQEPFVFIDWTSGKLSPLYKIDITEGIHYCFIADIFNTFMFIHILVTIKIICSIFSI
jgi:hypothetical protein